MPFESTQTISVIGSWFNHPEDSTIRDVEELEEIFYVSTSNDNCLLLNIPPATNGEQNPKAIENVMQTCPVVRDRGWKRVSQKVEQVTIYYDRCQGYGK